MGSRFAQFRGRASRYTRLAWAGLCCLMAGWGFAADPATPAREYPLKAVFLFKFIKFVDWPANTFPAANSPLVIGIVGDDPFGTLLDQVFQGETARNRPVIVKRLRPADDVKSCHVLFISRSESDRLPALVAQLGTQAVLTIGDTPGFAEQGVMANLVLAGEIINLEINQAAAQPAGIQISSKLLNLDRVTKIKPARPPTRP